MRKILFSAMIASMTISFTSCRDTTQQKTQEAVEAIGKDIEDNTKKAGKKIEEGAKKVKDDVNNGINKNDDVN